MSSVSIVKGKDPSSMVTRAIDLLGGLTNFVEPGQQVFIKPNVCGGVPGKPGSYTNLAVIATVMRLCRELNATITVGEADSCMYTADVMLPEIGIHAIAAENGAEVVHLSQGEMKKLESRDGFVLNNFLVHKAVAEADVIIAIPVMKTHISTTVTLGMKTIFGVLPEKKKSKYHPKLDHVLVDVVSALPPQLTIIDATTAMEGEGPFKGDPVELGVILAGNNVVSTDACGAALMGFDPSAIDHLRIASEKGLGTITVDDIELKGESLESVKRPFKPAPSLRIDRTISRISQNLGYYGIHRHYEQAVKSWQTQQRAKKNS